MHQNIPQWRKGKKICLPKEGSNQIMKGYIVYFHKNIRVSVAHDRDMRRLCRHYEHLPESFLMLFELKEKQERLFLSSFLPFIYFKHYLTCSAWMCNISVSHFWGLELPVCATLPNKSVTYLSRKLCLDIWMNDLYYEHIHKTQSDFKGKRQSANLEVISLEK